MAFSEEEQHEADLSKSVGGAVEGEITFADEEEFMDSLLTGVGEAVSKAVGEAVSDDRLVRAVVKALETPEGSKIIRTILGGRLIEFKNDFTGELTKAAGELSKAVAATNTLGQKTTEAVDDIARRTPAAQPQVVSQDAPLTKAIGDDGGGELNAMGVKALIAEGRKLQPAFYEGTGKYVLGLGDAIIEETDGAFQSATIAKLVKGVEAARKFGA